MAARQEWNEHEKQRLARDSYHNGWPVGGQRKCRSKDVTIIAAELANVESGDGDRVDYAYQVGSNNDHARSLAAGLAEAKLWAWHDRGAASIEIQRYLINKYRRPGKSNRDADLGGPVDAAGVLYVLVVKAPK